MVADLVMFFLVDSIHIEASNQIIHVVVNQVRELLNDAGHLNTAVNSEQHNSVVVVLIILNIAGGIAGVQTINSSTHTINNNTTNVNSGSHINIHIHVVFQNADSCSNSIPSLHIAAKIGNIINALNESLANGAITNVAHSVLQSIVQSSAVRKSDLRIGQIRCLSAQLSRQDQWEWCCQPGE